MQRELLHVTGVARAFRASPAACSSCASCFRGCSASVLPGALPGVLLGCSGLSALDLQCCSVQDVHAASPAVAALPKLQCLIVAESMDAQGRLALAQQQHPLQVIHLSLGWCEVGLSDQHTHAQLLLLVVLQQPQQLVGRPVLRCPTVQHCTL